MKAKRFIGWALKTPRPRRALRILMSVVLAFAPVLPGVGVTYAQAQQSVPVLMNFQGRLTDASNNPLSGAHSFKFEIYTAASGGTQLWTETQPAVSVVNGVFAAQLGAVNPLTPAVFSSSSTFLQITADGVALSPREALITSPFAFNAQLLQGRDYAALVSTDTAQTIAGAKTFTSPVSVAAPTAAGHAATKAYVDGQVASGGSGWIKTGTVVTLTNPATDNVVIFSTLTVQGEAFSVGGSTFVVKDGSIGVGTTAPAALLDVNGNAQFGSGVAKSTFSIQGGLFMAPGSSITLSGPSGWITTASSVTASAFFGDGSQLTGIAAGSKVDKAGDTMTGQLTNTSTVTVLGNAFSVGGSTLTVVGGKVGVGTTAPRSGLAVATGRIANQGSPDGTAAAAHSFTNSDKFSLMDEQFVSSDKFTIGERDFGSTTNDSEFFLVAAKGNASPGYGGAITFYTEANSVGFGERMRIAGNGNIGVGTPNPGSKLDVDGAAQFGGGVAKSTFSAAGGLFMASGSSITLSGPGGWLTTASSVTASAFFGDGSQLTGIGASSKVDKAGDTMTGQLTNTSTVTVLGNAFSVGGSTLAVKDGRVGIGTTNTTHTLEVGGTSRFSGGATVFGTGTFLDLSSDAYMLATAGAGKSAGYTANRDDLSKYASFDLLNSGNGGTGWSIQMVPNSSDLQVSDRASGGLMRMYFKSGGNVGVGSTTPAYKLHVSSAAGSSERILAVSTGTAEPGFYVTGDGKVYGGQFIGDGSGLSGIGVSGKVDKGGDTMTGQLTVSQSSITVVNNSSGDSFSLAVTTAADRSVYHLAVSTSGTVEFGGLLRRRGAAAYGDQSATHINLGNQTATGASGQNYVNATVAGGALNGAVNDNSTVGGGYNNQASGPQATIAGGSYSTAVGQNAAVGGGYQHQANNQFSTIAGGYGNIINGDLAAIGGGQTNTAGGGRSVIGGGQTNSAAGNYATVPGGNQNAAAGDYSLAAGNQAVAGAKGGFVWADSKAEPFVSGVQDEFKVRAQGGFYVGASSFTFLDLAGGTTYLYIQKGGDVGLGTVNPGGKLHVSSGVVIIDGAGSGLRFSDGTTQTTAASGASGWTQAGALSYTSNGALVQSTMTVSGNAFSVGGSTLAVKDGNVGFGSSAPAAKADVINNSDQLGLRVRGAASQTSAILQTETSGGASILRVWDPAGNQTGVTVNAQGDQGGISAIGSGAGLARTVIEARATAGQSGPILSANDDTSAPYFRVLGVNGGDAVQVFTKAVGQKGLTVNAMAGQTANIQEWQLGGAVKTVVDPGGSIGVGTASPAATLHVSSAPSAGGVPLVIVSTGSDASQYLLNIDNNGNIVAGTKGSSNSSFYVRNGPLYIQAPGSRYLGFVDDNDADRGSILMDDADMQLRIAGAYKFIVNAGYTASYVPFKVLTTSADRLKIGYSATVTDLQAWDAGEGTPKDLALEPSGGGVGIGTTSPGGKLHVSSGVVIIDGAGSGLRFSDGTTQTTAASGASGWTQAGALSYTSNGALVQSTMTVSGNAFSVGGSTLSVVDGRVGVGTTNPMTLLDVNGDAALRGQLTVAQSSVTIVDTNATGTGDAYSLAVTTAVDRSAYHLVVSTRGNVGVGASSPLYPLDVRTATALQAVNIVSGDPANGGTGVQIGGGMARGIYINNTGVNGYGIYAAAKVVGYRADMQAANAVAFDAQVGIAGGTGLSISPSANGTNLTGISMSASGASNGSTKPFIIYTQDNNAMSGDLLKANVTSAGNGSFTGNYINMMKQGASVLVANQFGSVGLSTGSPTHLLDVNGATMVRSSSTWAGTSTPSNSIAGQGAIYFDSGAGKFRVSENAGSYADLVPSGASAWTKDGGVVKPVTTTDNVVIQSTLTVQANAFSVGGSSFVVVGSSVGIRTSNPEAALNIVGGEFWEFNSGNNPRMILGDDGTSGNYGYLGWDSANDYYRIETDGVNGLKLKDNNVAIGNLFPSHPLRVGSGSSEYFRVDSSGNVGAGLEAARSTFTSAGNLQLVSGSTITSNGTLTLSTAPAASLTGAPPVFIDRTGFVGIGNSNPAAMLSVGSAGQGPASPWPNIFMTQYPTSGGAQFVGNWPGTNFWGIGPLSGSGDDTIRIGNSTDRAGTWSGTQSLSLVVGGKIGIGLTNPGAELHVKALNASTTAQILQAAVGQTADLQQWRDSTGYAMSSVDRLGRFVYGNDVPLTGAGISALSADVDQVVAVVRGLSGQNADLVQWQAVGGTVLAEVTAAGRLGIGTTGPAAKIHVLDGDIRVSTTPSASSRGVIFQDDTVQATAGAPATLRSHARSGMDYESASSKVATFGAGSLNFGVLGTVVEKTSDFTIDLGSGGNYLAGSDAANHWVYVVVDAAGNVKLTTDNPNASDPTGNTAGKLRYRAYSGTYYRYLRELRTDGSNNILPMTVADGSRVVWNDSVNYVNDGTATTYTGVSLTSRVPPTSTRAILGVKQRNGSDGTANYIRPTGSGATGTFFSCTSVAYWTQMEVGTDTSQSIDYILAAGYVWIDVDGFVSKL